MVSSPDVLNCEAKQEFVLHAYQSVDPLCVPFHGTILECRCGVGTICVADHTLNPVEQRIDRSASLLIRKTPNHGRCDMDDTATALVESKFHGRYGMAHHYATPKSKSSTVGQRYGA